MKFTSTTMSTAAFPPSNHPISLYTPAQLRSNTSLMTSLTHLINQAYAKHTAFNSRPRISDPHRFLDQLGPRGICAIMTDGDRMICTASYAHWRPAAGSVPDLALKQDVELLKLVDEGLSWEVKGVAVLSDPLYIGKGLAGQCISAVRQEVLKQNGSTAFAEWIELSEEQNGAYWRRRGYVPVGESELMPKGTWGSEKDFWYTTMVRRVAGPTTDDGGDPAQDSIR